MNASSQPRSLVVSLLLVLVVAGAIFGIAFGSMFLFRGQSADQLIAQRWEQGGKSNVGSDNLAPAPEQFALETKEKIPFEPKWRSTQEMIDTAPEIELVEKTFKPYSGKEYTLLVPPEVKEGDEPNVFKITDQVGLGINQGTIDTSNQWQSVRENDYRGVKTILMDNDNVLVYECNDPSLGERRYRAVFSVQSGLMNYRIFLKSPSNNYESEFTLEECQLAAKVAMSLDIHEPDFTSPIDLLKFYELEYQPEDATDSQAITEIVIPREAPASVLASLEKFPNLESLTVSMGIDQPNSFEVIAKLPKLKRLIFSVNSTATSVFSSVLKAKQLETLEISSYGELTDAQIDQLPQLTKLKQLSLEYTKDSQNSLQALTKMPNLEALEIIFHGEASPKVTANIAAIPQLKRLKVKGESPLTDELLAPLTGCQTLECLMLDDDRLMLIDDEKYQSRLTDATLATIGKIKTLRQLEIKISEPNEKRQNVQFTAEGWSQLSDLPLTMFILIEVKQGQPIADAIVPMKNLEYLMLKGSVVEMEDLKRIVSAQKSLKTLIISDNDKVKSFLDLMKAFPHLNLEMSLYDPLQVIQ